MSPERLALAPALALFAAGVLGCAVATRPAGPRRWLGYLGGLAALLAALAIPAELGLARLFAAAFGLLALGRSLDLVRRPGSLSLGGRALMMVAMVDLRAATPTRPRLDLRELGWWLGHLAVLAGCWTVVYVLIPAPEPGLALGLRWLVGLALIYALAEVIQSSVLLVSRALGFEVPRINDYPLLSRSLAEFWGRRWNRVVSGWLADYLFVPLARRRRAKLGLGLAFCASAALHFWLAWIPLDASAGLAMASFFLIQGLALAAERKLELRRWSLARQRGWTGAWIVLSSPLFVAPGLRMLDLFNRAAQNLLALI